MAVLLCSFSELLNGFVSGWKVENSTEPWRWWPVKAVSFPVLVLRWLVTNAGRQWMEQCGGWQRNPVTKTSRCHQRSASMNSEPLFARHCLAVLKRKRVYDLYHSLSTVWSSDSEPHCRRKEPAPFLRTSPTRCSRLPGVFMNFIYEASFCEFYRYLAIIDQILLAFRSTTILIQNFWVEGKPSFHRRPIVFEKFVLNLEVVLNPEVGSKNGRSNIGLIEISLNLGKPLTVRIMWRSEHGHAETNCPRIGQAGPPSWP